MVPYTAMDLSKMIAELEAEKTRLDEAILALERLSAGKVRRRGRPQNEELQPEPKVPVTVSSRVS